MHGGPFGPNATVFTDACLGGSLQFYSGEGPL